MASNTNSSATCGICLELYQDPRMLNCLHSFCKKCLEKRLDDGPSKSSLACPTCNESSSLSSCGIESLSKDHRKTYEAEVAEFEGLIKGEKSVSCDHCVKRERAALFCCSCCEFLCEKCADHHRSWRKTQNHELVSCTKQGGKKNILKSVAHKPLTCSVHSKESLDYYCNTCNDLLCIRCVVGKHKEHAYEEMDSAREKEISELISYLGKAEAAKGKLKNSISQVEKVMQGVQAKHKEVDQKINEMFNHLQCKLKARKNALLAKSADVALGKETALTLQGEELKKMEHSLSEICSKLESVTQEYTAVEMLSAKHPITIRAQQLLDTFDISSLDPCKLDIMPVSLLSTQLENEIDAFGAVCGGCMPGRSTIDLVKPTAAVGKERKLLLTARDGNGKLFPHGGELVKVSLALMGSNEAGISGVVVDKKDGTYGISFTPNTAGEHKLSITISNEQIEESPFALYVRQPRNYTSLSACSRTFSVSSSSGDVAVDDDNNVYIAVNGHHCISVFDQNGSNIRTIGTARSIGSADSQFNNPLGIALKGDIMYVADTNNNRIKKLTLDGKFISKFGSSGSGNEQLSDPRGIAIDKNGRVFVSESINQRVSVFQSDGEFSHHIQGNAADNSTLAYPWGLAFDNEENLHVADYTSHLIKVFTPEGKFVSQYGSGIIQSPAGIAINDEGFTFIGEHKSTRSRLIILNSQHQQVHTIQNFNYVLGVCNDKDGNVFVCDHSNKRVMKY
ncbi:E3 ubiquitin-protein ligase TRIM71-like [Halichondria panicea]|uniref:E3 ubiquitin-protein ligase TRIM71-like n=1 Tax=Halichondria panicea TaxID=6063 RepID=UPI00312B59F2